MKSKVRGVQGKCRRSVIKGNRVLRVCRVGGEGGET